MISVSTYVRSTRLVREHVYSVCFASFPHRLPLPSVLFLSSLSQFSIMADQDTTPSHSPLPLVLSFPSWAPLQEFRQTQGPLGAACWGVT